MWPSLLALQFRTIGSKLHFGFSTLVQSLYRFIVLDLYWVTGGKWNTALGRTVDWQWWHGVFAITTYDTVGPLLRVASAFFSLICSFFIPLFAFPASLGLIQVFFIRAHTGVRSVRLLGF
jgi:hypothetical protein